MCDYCPKLQCDGECINLTDEELVSVMGFDPKDIAIIKDAEKGGK